MGAAGLRRSAATRGVTAHDTAHGGDGSQRQGHGSKRAVRAWTGHADDPRAGGRRRRWGCASRTSGSSKATPQRAAYGMGDVCEPQARSSAAAPSYGPQTTSGKSCCGLPRTSWRRMRPTSTSTRGVVFVKGSPDRSMTVAELAHITLFRPLRRPPTGEVEPVLSASRHYDPPETYSYGSHCVIIELDPLTGRIDITRIVAVEDCGTMINPKVVEGQMRAGISQASAWPYWNRWTTTRRGSSRMRRSWIFLVPNALTLPDIECAHLSHAVPVHGRWNQGMRRAAMLSVHWRLRGRGCGCPVRFRSAGAHGSAHRARRQVLDLIRSSESPHQPRG